MGAVGKEVLEEKVRRQVGKTQPHQKDFPRVVKRGEMDKHKSCCRHKQGKRKGI